MPNIATCVRQIRSSRQGGGINYIRLIKENTKEWCYETVVNRGNCAEETLVDNEFPGERAMSLARRKRGSKEK